MVYHLVTPLGKVSTMVCSRQYQLVENGGHGGKMVTIMVTMVETVNKSQKTFLKSTLRYRIISTSS